MQKSAAVLAAVTLLIAAPLRAQNGLFFGPHATGASLASQNSGDPLNVGSGNPLDFGSGFGAHAGLSFRRSFGRSFGLLASFDRTIVGAKTGDVDLGQWDLLGRMSVVSVGPATAYLTAGLSTSALRSSAIYQDRERSPSFGNMKPTAGVTGQMFVTSKLAVDAG